MKPGGLTSGPRCNCTGFNDTWYSSVTNKPCTSVSDTLAVTTEGHRRCWVNGNTTSGCHRIYVNVMVVLSDLIQWPDFRITPVKSGFNTVRLH